MRESLTLLNYFLVLSVDFDFWFPGWSIGEKEAHCGYCRLYRDKSYTRLRPEEADIPQSTEIPFQRMVDLVKPGTRVYVSECHADIVGVLKRHKANGRALHVYDIDHHVDCGSDVGGLGCGNWITAAKNAHLIGKNTWHRITEEGVPRSPDVVFTCKSSPYMVREGDDSWHAWLSALECKDCKLTFRGWRRRTIKRGYEQWLGF